jgi:hypothetical protein
MEAATLGPAGAADKRAAAAEARHLKNDGLATGEMESVASDRMEVDEELSTTPSPTQ